MIYMIKRYHVNTEARFHPLTSEVLSLGALITVSTQCEVTLKLHVMHFEVSSLQLNLRRYSDNGMVHK